MSPFEPNMLYVHRAPQETDTPVRRALAAEDWWEAAAAAAWG